MTDAELGHLVVRAREGDQQALSRVAEECRPWAVSLARWWTPDPDSAQDLAAEALLRAITRLPQLRDPARFRNWLASIIRSLGLRVCQRPLPRPMSPSRLSALAASSGESSCLILDLRAALARLPAASREALLLSAADGLSYSQIGATLGLPLASIRSRLYRARVFLRKELGHMAPQSLERWLRLDRPPTEFRRRVQALAEQLSQALPPGVERVTRPFSARFLDSLHRALPPALRRRVRDADNPVMIACLPVALQRRLSRSLYRLWEVSLRAAALKPPYLSAFQDVVVRADASSMVFWRLPSGRRSREWGTAYRAPRSWTRVTLPQDTGAALALAGKQGARIERMASDLARLLPPQVVRLLPGGPDEASLGRWARIRLASFAAFPRTLPKCIREQMGTGHYLRVSDLPKRSQDHLLHALHLLWAEGLLCSIAKPVVLRDLGGSVVFSRPPTKRSRGCIAAVHARGLGGFFVGDPPRRHFCWPPRKYHPPASTRKAQPQSRPCG